MLLEHLVVLHLLVIDHLLGVEHLLEIVLVLLPSDPVVDWRNCRPAGAESSSNAA